MLSEKWRSRSRIAGRVILVAAVIYLFVLDDKIDSMQSHIDSIQSDVSSIQSDVSSIEGGFCSNSRICP
jgi:peptidoglycan hydrolase CwlO-like protein